METHAGFPLILGPMAGYTDTVFRSICKAHGADRTVTEMVSAKGLLYNSEKTRSLLETAPDERPVAVQIFGREPGTMADMAKRLVEEMDGAAGSVDINMGCPARKITSNGEGSALMLEPLLAGQIMEAVVKASPVPVTVKIRKGWDEAHENAPELARIAEASGISAVAVHGRTREQQYSGAADYGAISRVKAAVSIPVIGNGDVTDGESAKRMRAESGCDGIMIARGALGNPWVFEEVRCALDGVPYAPPDRETVILTAVGHLRRAVELKGRQGLLELRKHLVWYFRGTRGAAAVRTRLQTAETAEETEQILLDTLEKRSL